MEKIRIAMVSYLNSIPFKYGIEHMGSKRIELTEKNPAECARLFFNDKVDVALLPVGALMGNDNYKIFSNHCIGSIGKVRTVSLFTNDKLDNINKVYLDSHSRTSVLLVKLMLKESNCNNIKFIDTQTENLELEAGEAKLMIGDKVFRNTVGYKYIIDLSEWWENHTGLPFVFAVWVKNDKLEIKDENMLSESFGYGVQNLAEVLKTIDSEIDLKAYFKRSISYDFDDKKREALALFFKKLNENEII